MARRKRKTSARVVTGLPVIRRKDDLLEPIYEADPDGRPAVHHRIIDTLGIMLRAGTITQEIHDAARDFQAQFTIARFDASAACRWCGSPGGGGQGDLTDAQVDARRRVGEARDALGGLGSPAGAASGTSSGCSARSASGRCARAGEGGRRAPSRRREFWSRRWGYWRGGMGMGRAEGEQRYGRKSPGRVASASFAPVCNGGHSAESCAVVQCAFPCATSCPARILLLG